MTYSVLLVEDDAATARMVRFYLEQDHLRVAHVDRGDQAVETFRASRYDLIVLDMMLPGKDGVAVCAEIRSFSTVPILMLTAKQSDVDKAVAFGQGADDYLSKPFSPTELISRVRALLRRTYEFNRPEHSNPQTQLPAKILGGPRLLLDVSRHRLTLDGASYEVTPVEFALLEALMEAPGWVCTREQLLRRVWPAGEEAVEETVTVHISNLRQKLGRDGGSLIRTVRGVGYTYEETGGS